MKEMKEYSFWDLITEYHIEIPGIQRDYAQGRKSESRIAKSLIDDLFDALNSTDSRKINLNFVYGKTDELGDKLCLVPLDGQQRLTTLFLLHWFLSYGILKDKGTLSKFRYETRPSSEDFCLKLVKEDIACQYDENKRISEQIENSKWFFLSWKNDPTISAMLNMLDIIQYKFKKPDEGLFEKLVGKDSPVRFHFLPLDKFKLDDRIYVKMNARGKPLTEFENFKAKFSTLFEIENKSKLDNEWLDIFWKLEKDKANISVKEVDKNYLNFLKNISLNFYVETKEIDKTFRDEFKIIDWYEEVYFDSSYIKQLITVFDSLTSYEDSKKYFQDFLKDTPTYREMLLFYSIMQFFIVKGTINEKNTELYEKWVRVCRNLINNSLIDDPKAFCNAIRSVKKLSNHIDCIYEYLKNQEPKIDFFTQKQCDEEKIKASLLDDERWKTAICEIENHDYFDGQIGFILEFAKKDEMFDIVLFNDYSTKLSKLFSSDFSNKHLFQRALLTFGDYLVDIHSSRTFCTFKRGLREKVDNWRKVFDDPIRSIFLKNLLDKINVNSIEGDLKKIVTNYSEQNWKALFIKNEGIIEYCFNFRIAHWGKKIALAQSDSNGWVKHAELYSFTLLKTKLQGVDFFPFKRVGYWPTSHNEPCAYIDNWFWDKYNFALDIIFEYKDDSFKFSFFDRNGHQVPHKFQSLFDKFDFKQDETSNRWHCLVKENDFDKIKERIDDIVKEMRELSNKK